MLPHLPATATTEARGTDADAKGLAPDLGTQLDQAVQTGAAANLHAAASGLRMRAPDLARVGQLLLQRGQWEGRSVVPADWVDASITPRAQAFDGVKYGYHWYLGAQRNGAAMVMGFGWGGQRLVVVPALELVYVIFMGNYSRPGMAQLKGVFAVQGLIHKALR